MGYQQEWCSLDEHRILPSSDILAGTISISDILKSLILNGVITGKEYISGVEFGPEPGSGSGSLLVNSLSYQWNGTPTIKLHCRK